MPPCAAYSSMSYFSRKPNWWQATKLAFLIRYEERIGPGPKRRCEIVIAPDFFES